MLCRCEEITVKPHGRWKWIFVGYVSTKHREETVFLRNSTEFIRSYSRLKAKLTEKMWAFSTRTTECPSKIRLDGILFFHWNTFFLLPNEWEKNELPKKTSVKIELTFAWCVSSVVATCIMRVNAFACYRNVKWYSDTAESNGDRFKCRAYWVTLVIYVVLFAQHEMHTLLSRRQSPIVNRHRHSRQFNCT